MSGSFAAQERPLQRAQTAFWFARVESRAGAVRSLVAAEGGFAFRRGAGMGATLGGPSGNHRAGDNPLKCSRGHFLNTLSVLLPVYNAQGKLSGGVAEILEILSQWSGPFELCILDDGSSDDTADEARELAARFPQIRLIRHPVRLGLNEAIQTGLDHTDGELVLVSNEDYELEPDDLRMLWRLRDAQRRARRRNPAGEAVDPRLETLLAWKPNPSDGRRPVDVIPRDAFEQFRLRQAIDMVHRVDGPRTNPFAVIARRLKEPKYLKMAGQFAAEE
jgi:hypothetical protein